MKSLRLPILLLAAAAASASGAAGAASLTYDDPNCAAFSLVNNVVTCSTPVTPTTAGAPACTLTATPSAITAGASVTLTASCTSGTTNYNWSSNTGLGTNTTASSGTVAPTVTTIYSVAGSISGGVPGATATATVTVNSPTAPPPTGDDTLCTDAKLQNTVMQLDWQMGYNKRVDIGQNKSISFPLTLPSTSTGGSVSMVYTAGGDEVISISQRKCDFAPSLCLVSGGQPTLSFKKPSYPYLSCKLTAGVPYYINVRSANVNSVTSGTMSFQY